MPKRPKPAPEVQDGFGQNLGRALPGKKSRTERGTSFGHVVLAVLIDTTAAPRLFRLLVAFNDRLSYRAPDRHTAQGYRSPIEISYP